jgi:hypothetical protein
MEFKIGRAIGKAREDFHGRKQRRKQEQLKTLQSIKQTIAQFEDAEREVFGSDDTNSFIVDTPYLRLVKDTERRLAKEIYHVPQPKDETP